MKQLIFVVEDEIEVSELAQWCLEEAGYAVRLFSTSNVIQDAEDGHPSLLLITMMMPDGNGLDLCRQIREDRTMLIVFGAVPIRHHAGKTTIVFLVRKGLVIDQGKSLDRLRTALGHKRDDTR